MIYSNSIVILSLVLQISNHKKKTEIYPVASFNMYPIALRKNTVKLCCANHLEKYGAVALIQPSKHTCGFCMNCCCSFVKVYFLRSFHVKLCHTEFKVSIFNSLQYQ
jgi:hypothetical protein